MSLLASSWTTFEGFLNGPFVTNGVTTVGTLGVATIAAYGALKAKGRAQVVTDTLGEKNGKSVMQKLDSLAANQNALLTLMTEHDQRIQSLEERND